MKSTENLKYGTVAKNYYGHNGAIYAGDKLVIREIKSKKIKVETMTGKIYWLNSEIVKIT